MLDSLRAVTLRSHDIYPLLITSLAIKHIMFAPLTKRQNVFDFRDVLLPDVETFIQVWLTCLFLLAV